MGEYACVRISAWAVMQVKFSSGLVEMLWSRSFDIVLELFFHRRDDPEIVVSINTLCLAQNKHLLSVLIIDRKHHLVPTVHWSGTASMSKLQVGVLNGRGLKTVVKQMIWASLVVCIVLEAQLSVTTWIAPMRKGLLTCIISFGLSALWSIPCDANVLLAILIVDQKHHWYPQYIVKVPAFSSNFKLLTISSLALGHAKWWVQPCEHQ